MRSSFTSSGLALNRMLNNIVFKLTLLPAPVAPATRRWGIVFRSALTAPPKISFPSARLSLEREREKESLVTTSFIDTVSR